MKRKQTCKFISAALLGGVMAVTGCSSSGDKVTIDRSTVDGLPSITRTETTYGQVKIEAVDYDNRSIALQGPDGNSEIFKCPPEVKNFDQIKEGDVVKVQYLQTLDVNVQKVGEPLSVTETAGFATAPLGDKPGIVAVRTVQTQANVQAIDYQARTVTLVGINNKPITIHVSDKLKSFDSVKVGDQVTFTYTEAVSIDVSK